MADNTNMNLRNKVIYQVFTRNYKDGTFRALTGDLDRIKALGVDIIYLMPIQPNGEKNKKGTLGSPYAVQDYRCTDPMQGSMEDFEALCNAVHEKGMLIIIDVVYNHTSPDSVLSKSHPEWFYKKEDGSLGNRIGDWWDVVDLDYDHKELWDYQIETLREWAGLVDGFRCDACALVPIEFWVRARSEVEKVHPNCIWLGETVEPEFVGILRSLGLTGVSDGEHYRAFDICYDYDTYGDMKRAMLGEEKLSVYLNKINGQEVIYPENYIKLRCLENHDRPRAAAMLMDERVLRNWTAFAFFMKGTTMLYMGEEMSEKHHPTLFDHDRVDLESKAFTGDDMSRFIRTLSDIKKNEIFSCGIFHAESRGRDESMIIATMKSPENRHCEKNMAVGIFSVTGEKCSVRVDMENGTYTDAISGRDVEVFENVMRFEGEPMILLV